MGSISTPQTPRPLETISRHEQTVCLSTELGDLKANHEALPFTSSSTKQTHVLKCLGFQYAEIPYRWAAPQKSASRWQGIKDCTNFGPGCPQSPRPLFDVEGIPMFGRLGPACLPIRAETEDEFGCLNLNIYAPVDIEHQNKVSLKSDKLPVLVWVHGGSYQVGSGGVEAYDGTEVVKRSVDTGSPLIVVTFNYRVGVLGFLHSPQLAKEASNQTDIPKHFRSTANLGLLDSYTAFSWIKDNIHNFGGDPDNITAMGESAGAGMIHYLTVVPNLHIKIPRIILSSSTCFSIQLLRSSEAQSWYNRICEAMSITPEASDAIQCLREIKVEDLISNSYFAYSSFRPIWDDVTITSDPREVISKPDLWDDTLEQIVFGVCKNEPWLRQACHPNKVIDMVKTINNRIPPVRDLRSKALELYSDPLRFPWFNSPKKDLSPSVITDVAFEGHARYYTPGNQVSQSFVSSTSRLGKKRSLYRYLFNWATSHWPSDWPVTHATDIMPMFLHGNLSPREREISLTMADNLIAFATNSIEKITWREYKIEDPVLNELDEKGDWKILEENAGIFDLNEEYLSFWRNVIDAVLETGAHGWAEMSR